MNLRWRLFIVPLAAVLLLGGCSTVGFLSQAGRGQLDILTRAKPVERVLSDPATSPELRRKLQLSQELTAYAEQNLGLKVGRQYQNYADLGRDSAVYSVVVAYPYQLKTRDFCYPIAGCVPYRGFFNRELAEREAAVWRDKGFDVVVGSVDAFSTLGYLPDPLLNTFIEGSDLALAELIFHELVHATIYVPGDVRFNESLATAFERIALERWIVDTGRTELRGQAAEARAAKVIFNQVIADATRRLKAVYAVRYPTNAAREAAKRAALTASQQYYLSLKPQLNGRSYDSFLLGDDFNNAKVLAVGVYDQQVPAFTELYRRVGGSIPAFFNAVEALAKRDKATRDRYLAALVR